MRTRISIDLTEEHGKALDEIRDATHRSSRAEVIRDALEMYDLIVRQVAANMHVYLGTARETAGEVLLPQLERARAKRLAVRPRGTTRSSGTKPSGKRLVTANEADR